MNHDELIEGLIFTNETLTATIVIVAASMLLYNLVRNIRDRVTRASAVMLGCVTLVFTVESLAALDPESKSLNTLFRLQWIGIAFMPAAIFHLADALLSTTGRFSRGRRRRVVRMLYVLSATMAFAAAFSDALVVELATEPISYMRPGSLFPLYTAYFVVACAVSIRFVWRARARCLTRNTRRRMTYLMIAFLTPALGVFPYTLLFASIGDNQDLPLLPLNIIFNLANLLVVAMLVFMAYPLSFFGSRQPDRLIKRDLLQFLLRGPFTAIIVLAVIVTAPRVSNGLGLKGEDFMIVSAVGVLLLLQWSITLALPILEDWFIYTKNQQEAKEIIKMSQRLLTRADRAQLLEAILAAAGNQLQVKTAFIAAVTQNGAVLEQKIGDLRDKIPNDILTTMDIIETSDHLYCWHTFLIFPLYGDTPSADDDEPAIVGILGINNVEGHLDNLTEEDYELLDGLRLRAAKILHDRQLQTAIFDTIQNFYQETQSLQAMAGITQYGHLQKDLINQPDLFVDTVRGALRDFWGGPRLSDSKLLSLEIVQEEMRETGSPITALQSVLTRAIENLKPNGERSMTTTEWILYNILELRFLQGRKVRDVALQLAMSEPDFYRKQKIAIEEVAKQIGEMEEDRLNTLEASQPEPAP